MRNQRLADSSAKAMYAFGASSSRKPIGFDEFAVNATQKASQTGDRLRLGSPTP